MLVKGEKKSHICGLWMLITATFRCVKEGSMAGGSWERPSQPRLGAHWGSSGTAKHTQVHASKGSAVFYQNITSLKPRSRPAAHGMRGYLTKSAVLCCRSSLTGDFCKCSQWAERLHGSYCVKRVSSVGDKTQTPSLTFFQTKTPQDSFFFFLTNLCGTVNHKEIIGRYLSFIEMYSCNNGQENRSAHCP